MSFRLLELRFHSIEGEFSCGSVIQPGGDPSRYPFVSALIRRSFSRISNIRVFSRTAASFRACESDMRRSDVSTRWEDLETKETNGGFAGLRMRFLPNRPRRIPLNADLVRNRYAKHTPLNQRLRLSLRSGQR
jgi:hypothetical protein